MDPYNLTALCGSPVLDIWNPHTHTLGLCFQKLFIITPVFAILAIVSAFYIGRQYEHVERRRNELVLLYCRMSVVLTMIMLSVVIEPVVLLLEADVKIFWADIVSFGVQGLAWTVHLIYLANLKERQIGSSVHGSKVVLFAWLLTVTSSILLTETVYTTKFEPKYRTVMQGLVVTQLALQVLYSFTIFSYVDSSGTIDSVPGYRELDRDRLQQPGTSSGETGHYTRFHEVSTPYYLGTAEADATPLSHFTLHWVGALLQKGSVGLLQSVQDLHALPSDLQPQQIAYAYRRQLLISQPLPKDDRAETMRTQRGDLPHVQVKSGDEKTLFSLFWTFHHLYCVQFYSLGLLKLISDACGFAGPLLLHELVSYVDYKQEKPWKGYIYSLCLCAAALVSSLCSTHFNYYLARLNIKVRAALITAISRKVQNINTAQTSHFTSGQIVNFMSTDTDRVLNFGQSFHSFWSLPLQLLITLYLLYVQIGIAFLAGVAIIILLMPINKLLASKIGTLSEKMMSFKDKRVTLMTELLSMIKSVKLNTWEEVFTKRINEEREGELSALAGRKYLDAACVYFWAATPVFIPIFTFSCYVLMGNEMDAARVFTAVAFFNMLIMPLNAFPWVINGLVESYVSCRRIEKLLQMEDQDLSQYYTIVAEMSNNAELQLLIRDATFSWEETGRSDENEVTSEESEEENYPSDGDSDGYTGTPIASRKAAKKAKGKRRFGGQKHSDEESLFDSVDEEEEDDDDGLNIMASRSTDYEANRQHRQHRPKKLSKSIKVLKDINLTIGRGEVVAIIGKTGSGKSSLVNAILAELVKNEGIVAVAGLHHGFGYSSQDPWIQDITIRENIVFDSEFEQNRYERVLYSCALLEDLRKMPKGDQTKCGENGQCLSGGQKARVSLARAIYQQKGIYILDAPLSSVDGPVARHIMKEVVLGFLKGKTVILTTHHIHLTTRCHTIVSMEGGRIAYMGSPDDILPNFLSSQDLLRDWWYDDTGEDWERTGTVPRSNTLPRQKGKHPQCKALSSSSHSSYDLKETHRDHTEGVIFMEEHERYALINVDAEDPSLEGSSNREFQEVGGVSWGVYNTYITAIGCCLVVLILMAIMGMQFSRNLTDLWLAYWVSHSPSGSTNLTSFSTSTVQHYDGSASAELRGAPSEGLSAEDVASFGSWLIEPNLHTHTHVHPFSWVSSISNFVKVPHLLQQSHFYVPSDKTPDSPSSPSNQFYLMVYCLIAVVHSVFTILRAFGFAYCGVKAAKNLHNKLFKSILKSSMVFFEMNPVGRVLNRFSTDLYTVDDSLPFMLNIFLAQLFGLLGSIIITVYSLPWMTLVYIPVGMIYFNIQNYYRYTSRDLRRIYALSLSPMYAHFTEMLNGLPTIRAMRVVNTQNAECEALVSSNLRAQLAIQAASQWLNLRLQLLGVLILMGVCALALLQHHTLAIDAGIVGLVISYALTINGFLNSVVTSFTETEREFISVERLSQYISDTPRDGLSHNQDNNEESYAEDEELDSAGPSVSSAVNTQAFINPGSDFPLYNTIRFDNVYVRYNVHTPHALKKINLRVGANEKIGILGRTGAGKSSLFSVLFRLVEPCRGSVFIDNVDITNLSLKRLRSCMAIVPQHAPLFTGTIRQNVDPFGKHSDTAIWSALSACFADTSILSAIARAKRVKELNSDSTQTDENVLSTLDHDMADIGRNLSQGERQLLVLARAMLSQAKIVCLDEGTAQLDPQTDELVQRTLRECFKNVTLLIIAHRIRTLSYCDRLVVLEDGEIVEEGSPHELMVRSESRYSQLLRKQ